MGGYIILHRISNDLGEGILFCIAFQTIYGRVYYSASHFQRFRGGYIILHRISNDLWEGILFCIAFPTIYGRVHNSASHFKRFRGGYIILHRISNDLSEGILFYLTTTIATAACILVILPFFRIQT